MKNALVSEMLVEIANRLEMQDVPFKPRAYRRAAETIGGLGEPIEDLVERGEHEGLPGIGKAISEKVAEIVETGRLAYLDRLRAELPIDLPGLTRVEGLGPKTAKLLYDALGVKSLDDLATAAAEGRIAEVKGLGLKTQAKLLKGIEEARRLQTRVLLGDAMEMAEDLIAQLEETGLFDRLRFAGSLRRGRETIGDLDLLGTAVDSKQAMEAFRELGEVADVLVSGETKTSVRLSSGMQVDLRIVPEPSYGAALQYFTGSQAHNVALRKRAVSRGWKLNEYALSDAEGTILASADEPEIYEALELAFIPPELREDAGELVAAEHNELPKLVEAADIRCDLHVHTDWSDGRASLETMVIAAQRRGLDAIAITDHALFAEVIRGLTPDNLCRQMDEIARLNQTLEGFRVFTGIEVNTQPDGSLDVDDRLLAKLDVVIASVHSHFRQSRDQATERFLRVLENPHVDILGHPTTRKIGIRSAMDVDWDAVFETAARNGVALEVNANPIRLDLNADHIRRAVSAGCRLAINTDAHCPEHFDLLRYGVLTARRGWATVESIVNTRANSGKDSRG